MQSVHDLLNSKKYVRTYQSPKGIKFSRFPFKVFDKLVCLNSYSLPQATVMLKKLPLIVFEKWYHQKGFHTEQVLSQVGSSSELSHWSHSDNTQ